MTGKTMETQKLTEKQKNFCREYLVDLNATQASVRSGYSKKTAGAIGRENLQKPAIQKQLQILMDKRAEKTEITAEQVLQDINEIKTRTMETGKEFDPKSALKALELLGKHLVLFSDKIQHGFDDATLNTILSALPAEYAEAVRALLAEIIKK